MAEKKNPEIRFKGFNDNWEQRKLDNEVIFYNGLTYSPADVIDSGGTLVLRSSNVKDGEIIDSDNVYVSSEVVNSDNVQVGDVIVVVRNGSRSLIGKHAQIKKTMNNTVIGAFMTGVRYQQAAFMNVLLSTSQFDSKVKKNMGATINQITTGAFKEMQFYFPLTDEQKRIGVFFCNLDDLIALYQRKYEKLQNLKKAMLGKMFPKDGADVPEIRFKGFTDAWEKHKYGSIFNQRIEYLNPQESNIELWSLTVEKGLTPKTERYTRDFLVTKEDKYKAIKSGDIVYNPMNMTLGAIGYNDMPKTVAVSGYYVTMEPTKNIDGYFIKTLMQRPQSIESYKMNATGSLLEKQRVQYPAFSEIQCILPDFKEQTRIGAFFKYLDHLITLQQQELNKLQNIKNALLDKMFV